MQIIKQRTIQALIKNKTIRCFDIDYHQEDGQLMPDFGALTFETEAPNLFHKDDQVEMLNILWECIEDGTFGEECQSWYYYFSVKRPMELDHFEEKDDFS